MLNQIRRLLFHFDSFLLCFVIPQIHIKYRKIRLYAFVNKKKYSRVNKNYLSIGVKNKCHIKKQDLKDNFKRTS